SVRFSNQRTRARMLPVKAGRAILLIVFAAAVLAPLLALHWHEAQSVYDYLYHLGRAAALMGFVLLAFQVVLTSRWKLLDRLFAIDRTTNFHKRMGVLAACLLTADPVLIMLGSRSSALLSMDVPCPVKL